jgi:hypothetical protein
VSGDDVTPVYGAASFADKNVGTAGGQRVRDQPGRRRRVELQSFNATATRPTSRRRVTGERDRVNKVYDGTGDATVTG